MADEGEAYASWNARIALYWLTKPSASKHIYLTVTPAALARAAWECDGVRFAHGEAETDFVNAVRAMCHARIFEKNDDIGTLARVEAETPYCLAFLALAVLAAYRMQADASNRSTNYFVRLEQMLQTPHVGNFPKGISKSGFESLWAFANDWTAKRLGRPLHIPTEKVLRKYTALPLSHVGLRQTDLDKLPEFFDWMEYSPGSSIGITSLREDLASWMAASGRLTAQGTAAFSDERSDAVLEQVAQELQDWDGAVEDSSGRRVAHVELALDTPRRQPKLSYLARRPPGFPEVFDDGVHRFDSMDEGWYDPLPIPNQDGASLLNGFEWTLRSPERTVLRRAPTRVIAFVKSEDYSGFISRRRLLAGVDCALLFHASAASEVRARLAQLSVKGAPEIVDPSLPEGWHLLLDIKINAPTSDVVPGLEALEVDAAVELVKVGGLRIGRRAEWLVGSPPTVIVSGTHGEVMIDRKPVAVDAKGIVTWPTSNRGPGVHAIQAGRLLHRITLVEAEVAAGLRPISEGATSNYPLALARGRWVILGREPTQLTHAQMSTHEIALIPFDPVWAIRMATPGCALFLPSVGVAPNEIGGDASTCEPWARTVLSAWTRRTPLASLSFAACPAAKESWSAFVRVAQRLASPMTPNRGAS